VPLFAFGPGADQFRGTLDNAEVGRRIAQLLGVKCGAARPGP
jgi:alkaline phosphatase